MLELERLVAACRYRARQRAYEVMTCHPPPLAAVRVEAEGTNRRFYEFCVLSEMSNAVRSGDLWVVGSRQFRSSMSTS
jgi:hypothetical protein